MVNEIYELFASNLVIQSKVDVEHHIKSYEYPDTEKLTGCFIVIDPISTPTPGTYAGNRWITERHHYQIEVWSKNKADRNLVANEIRDIMWKQLGFEQNGEGIDQHDEDLKTFRDARRYRGFKYVI